MAPSEELAVYVGEAGNCLSDGTILVPGETVCQVPRSEAEASDLWKPVEQGTPASSSPRNAPPATSPPAVVPVDDGDDE